MNDGQPTQTIWTPSNVITITRILLVPAFVAALLCPWPDWFNLPDIGEGPKSTIAAAIFILISCTDWLDGYLARRFNQVTDFGKFMDPLADKILVAAALIALVELGSLPTWVVLIILVREFIVSGVRMMAARQGVVIAASWLGKFKTVFQMIAIVLFTVKVSSLVKGLPPQTEHVIYIVSWIVMIVALVLTIASMVDYLYKAREIIGLGKNAVPAKSPDVLDVASRIIERSIAGEVSLSTAESLTGGLVGSALTSVPGSSAVYRGGAVTYTNEMKHGLIGVDADVLETNGAVSEECALMMAEGIREKTESDIAVSTTGIAGPGGAEPGKPVGTVWIAVASPNASRAVCKHFDGDREEVRNESVLAALAMVEEELERLM